MRSLDIDMLFRRNCRSNRSDSTLWRPAFEIYNSFPRLYLIYGMVLNPDNAVPGVEYDYEGVIR